MKLAPTELWRGSARYWFLLFSVIGALRVSALDGALDPSYHAPFLSPIPNIIVVQNDGKSLVTYGSAGGVVGIARLDTNGASDAGYNTGQGPLIITAPIDIPSAGLHIPGSTNAGSIAALAVQTGGRAIVGGSFTHFGNTTVARSSLVRLKADGSVDTTFTAGNNLSGGQGGTSVQSVAVDETDRIYVGGVFAKFAGAARNTAIVRLKADGTLDNTFIDTVLAGLGSAVVQDITVQPDHKILITSTYYTASVQARAAVHRLLPNGGLDPDFLQGPGLSASTGLRHALLPTGQILVTAVPAAGATYNGVAVTGSVFRLNANGSVDSTYVSQQAKYFNTGLSALHMAPVADGRVYISGGFNSFGGVEQSGLVRLRADGTLDPTFVPPVSALIGGFGLAVQSDGKVLVQNVTLDGADLKYGIVRLLVSPPGAIAPKITVAPVGATVATGAQFVFSVTATGPNLVYQWRHNNADVPGANAATLTINPATSASAGEYQVVVGNNAGTDTSPAVQLVVLDPPHITTAPLGRTVIAGFETLFSVVATGAPTLKYQWYKNGQAIAGATSDTYRIAATAPADAGKYSATVSNSVGSDASAQVELFVNVPPIIAPQPQSQIIVLPGTLAGPCDGLTAANLAGHTLSCVVASGLPPFAANGNFKIVFAASGGTYSIAASGAIAASAGSWTLGPDLGVKTVVTLNHYFAGGGSAKIALLPNCTYELYADGLATSQGGTFSIGPAITIPPVSVSFVSGATGTGPFTYQWRHNGQAIQGATAAVLALTDVHASDLGQYTMVATGPGGSTESQPAILSEALVVPQPTLTFQVTGGTTLHFTIPAGFRLEQSPSLGALAWSNVPGTGTVDIPIASASAFFRLVQP